MRDRRLLRFLRGVPRHALQHLCARRPGRPDRASAQGARLLRRVLPLPPGLRMGGLRPRVRRVGTAICHDSDFFESWRILALKGAEVILLPHANRTMPAPDGTLSFDGSGARHPRPSSCRPSTSCSKVTRSRRGSTTCWRATTASTRSSPTRSASTGTAPTSAARTFSAPTARWSRGRAPVGETSWISADLDPELLRRVRANPMFALRKRRPDTYGELARPVCRSPAVRRARRTAPPTY